MPEISVVIPTRNRWFLLERALGSALAQRDVELEVLIVDDGSTDGSRERAEAVSDPRVRVVSQEHQGVAAARNNGIEQASAPWIALLDDDDLWAPSKCRIQMDALNRSSAQIAYTSAVVIDELLGFKRVLRAPDPDNILVGLMGSNTIGTPSSVIASRDSLMAAGGFSQEFSVLADWDMWLKLCASHSATACSATLVGYVEHEHNLHVVDTDSVLEEFTRLCQRHQSLTKLTGQPFGDINWWRWIAGSHRRAGRRRKAAWAYLQTGIRFSSARDLARAAAILGGERVMRRVALPVVPPDAESRQEWVWLEEGA